MAYFCSIDDMIRFLSAQGVTEFSDHSETGVWDSDVVDDARGRAADEITATLYPLYSAANLANSTLVKHWAVVVACFYLCTTRGNGVPASLAAEYERIMAVPDGLLERVKRGTMVLPGIPRTSVNVPAFSNLTIDRRFRREKIRVIPAISSPVESAIEQDKVPEISVDY